MPCASDQVNWHVPCYASPKEVLRGKMTRYSTHQLLFKVCPGNHGSQINEMADLSLEVRLTFSLCQDRTVSSGVCASVCVFSGHLHDCFQPGSHLWQKLGRPHWGGCAACKEIYFSVLFSDTFCYLLLGHWEKSLNWESLTPGQLLFQVPYILERSALLMLEVASSELHSQRASWCHSCCYPRARACACVCLCVSVFSTRAGNPVLCIC